MAVGPGILVEDAAAVTKLLFAWGRKVIVVCLLLGEEEDQAQELAIPPPPPSNFNRPSSERVVCVGRGGTVFRGGRGRDKDVDRGGVDEWGEGRLCERREKKGGARRSVHRGCYFGDTTASYIQIDPLAESSRGVVEKGFFESVHYVAKAPNSKRRDERQRVGREKRRGRRRERTTEEKGNGGMGEGRTARNCSESVAAACVACRGES